MQIRPTIIADLDTLFAFQLDEEASRMAAFMAENWTDRDAYIAKWTRLITEGKVYAYVIIVNDEIVGTVGSWQMGDEWQITYWVDKPYWGRGIATAALKEFLKLFTPRPLYGRAAFDNMGSITVMEKCGFRHVGNDMHYSHARREEIEEMIFKLD